MSDWGDVARLRLYRARNTLWLWLHMCNNVFADLIALHEVMHVLIKLCAVKEQIDEVNLTLACHFRRFGYADASVRV